VSPAPAPPGRRAAKRRETHDAPGSLIVRMHQDEPTPDAFARTTRAAVYAAAGAALGFAAGMAFMLVWTAMWSTMPAELLLRYMKGQALFIWAVALLWGAIGLWIGATRGWRWRPPAHPMKHFAERRDAAAGDPTDEAGAATAPDSK